MFRVIFYSIFTDSTGALAVLLCKVFSFLSFSSHCSFLNICNVWLNILFWDEIYNFCLNFLPLSNKLCNTDSIILGGIYRDLNLWLCFSINFFSYIIIVPIVFPPPYHPWTITIEKQDLTCESLPSWQWMGWCVQGVFKKGHHLWDSGTSLLCYTDFHMSSS